MANSDVMDYSSIRPMIRVEGIGLIMIAYKRTSQLLKLLDQGDCGSFFPRLLAVSPVNVERNANQSSGNALFGHAA